MAFNPKGKSLADILAKDISKKSIQKLAKKHNSSATPAPFFIKTDYKFKDGTVGPLFIFGKIKKYKSEINTLKGDTELHGLAFVETDSKGVTTLNLSPVKGKLDKKEAILKKAMKEAFTAAFANYKLLAAIAEADLEKALEQADAAPEEVETDEVDSTESTTAEPTTQNADNKQIALEAQKRISEFQTKYKETNAVIVPKVNQRQATEEDQKTVSGLLSTLEDMAKQFTSLPGVVQTALKPLADQFTTYKNNLGTLLVAIEGIVKANAKPKVTPEQQKAVEDTVAKLKDIFKKLEVDFAV